MSFKSGLHLLIWTGAVVPRPLPASAVAAVQSVQVQHSDAGASGFQIVFRAERGSPYNPLDYPLLLDGHLAMFNRIVIALRIGVLPRPLLDGVITDVQLQPAAEGGAILTVTGEDLGVLLDLDEKIVEHPAQNEVMIANKIIAEYAEYGLIPEVVPPPSLDVPLPTERMPVQHGTDLDYLRRMAARFAYEFYIRPGPAPLTSTAYWGPPRRVSVPQPALTANMGDATNLQTIGFRYQGMAAHVVSGHVQDSRSNQVLPIEARISERLPLARDPALVTQRKTHHTRLIASAGLSFTQALARAQADLEETQAGVVTADGTLDTLRYGHILEAHATVGVRGVGQSYDGIYYVQRVIHTLVPDDGTYTQEFTLIREGTGAITPIVRP